MRRNWRSTTISTTLPSFYPRISSHFIRERSIKTEYKTVIKPASASSNNICISCKPFHTPSSWSNTCGTNTIKHPLTNERIFNWGDTTLHTILHSTVISCFRNINPDFTACIAKGNIKRNIALYIRLNHLSRSRPIANFSLQGSLNTINSNNWKH